VGGPRPAPAARVAGGDSNALSVATVIGVTGVPIAAGCPRPLEWCGLDPAR
jgi:inosine-uridine nucleoside N-ribohydrolase